MITRCPAVLGLPPATLQAKVELLKALGLDPAKVVKHCPTIFNYSEARIRGTLAFLNGVGLDGRRIANNRPTVLCYSVDTKLRPIVQFVTIDMGRDICELQWHYACVSLVHVAPLTHR